MRIVTHAIENYLERVLNINIEQASDQMIEYAENQIRKAVESPDIIYHKEKESCPIHIRNGCAVPVEDEVIRTSYNAGTYLSKLEDNESTKARS